MATVVVKLVNLTGAHVAYFGEKDYQQLAVVRRLAADRVLPSDVRACPTVREPDGLALSSRNRYLSAEQRTAAAELPAALFAARDAIERGREPAGVERALFERLTDAGFAVDYAAVRDAATLGSPEDSRELRILVAAKLGETRLIDNVAAVHPG